MRGPTESDGVTVVPCFIVSRARSESYHAKDSDESATAFALSGHIPADPRLPICCDRVLDRTARDAAGAITGSQSARLNGILEHLRPGLAFSWADVASLEA